MCCCTDAPVILDLNLNLNLGSSLDSAKALLSGGGLRPFSTYTLEMHSTVVTIYTGTTDIDGNFSNYVQIPNDACVELGKHEMILSGIAPDGTPKADTQYIILDNACHVLGTEHNHEVRMISASGFLFGYNSAKLTKKAKNSLDSILVLLVEASTIDVYGYTQTNLSSKASIRANKILAGKRAKAVRKYLLAHGVSVQVNVISRGPVKPVSKKKQKLNRRVVITAHYPDPLT